MRLLDSFGYGTTHGPRNARSAEEEHMYAVEHVEFVLGKYADQIGPEASAMIRARLLEVTDGSKIFSGEYIGHVMGSKELYTLFRRSWKDDQADHARIGREVVDPIMEAAGLGKADFMP